MFLFYPGQMPRAQHLIELLTIITALHPIIHEFHRMTLGHQKTLPGNLAELIGTDVFIGSVLIVHISMDPEAASQALEH